MQPVLIEQLSQALLPPQAFQHHRRKHIDDVNVLSKTWCADAKLI